MTYSPRFYIIVTPIQFMSVNQTVPTQSSIHLTSEAYLLYDDETQARAGAVFDAAETDLITDVVLVEIVRIPN